MTNQDRVDQLNNISPSQREFLNKYINQESKSSVKSKLNQAEDFNRRRGKVLVALSKSPNVLGLQGNARQLLQIADQLAESGNFKEAYKQLDKVKSEAKRISQEFNPTELISSIESKANEIFTLHEKAAEEIERFNVWLLPYREACPPSDEERSVDEIQRLAELGHNFHKEWISDYSRWPAVLSLTSKVSSIDELMKIIYEVHRICLQKKVKSELPTIFQNLIQVNSYIGETTPKLVQYEHEVNAIRILLTSEVTSIEREMEGDKNAIESDPLPTQGRFNEVKKLSLTPFLESKEFKELSKVPIEELPAKAKSIMINWLHTQNLSPDSDEMLDLVTRSEKDFLSRLKSQYAKDNNLERNKLGDTVNERLSAISKGFFNAALEVSPNSIDNEAGTLTVGGTIYKDKVLLGSGSFGNVYEYTDEKGNKVVVKDLITKSERSKMKEEIVANHQLLKGDPNAIGRKNITQMKGAVQSSDGTLCMIMEKADGGDMNDLKSAMSVLNQQSSFQEGARNIINQYLLKGSIQGVQYLRDQNMVHFDLKELNIFLSKDGTPQVSDFGSVRSSESGKILAEKSGAGSAAYRDPSIGDKTVANERLELLQGMLEGNASKLNYKSVDALGITDMTPLQFRKLKREEQEEYLTKIAPLIRRKIEEIRQGGSHGTVDTSSDSYSIGKIAQGLHFGVIPKTEGNNPALASGTSGALKRIVSALTHEDPKSRPSLEQVMQSSYLENLNGVSETKIKELLSLVIEYGKAIDTKAIYVIEQKIAPVGSGSESLRDQLAEVERQMRVLDKENGSIKRHRELMELIPKLELQIGKTQQLQESYVSTREQELNEVLERINDEWKEHEIKKLTKLAEEIVDELEMFPRLLAELDLAEQELRQVEEALENEEEAMRQFQSLQRTHERIKLQIAEIENQIQVLSEPNPRAKQLKEEIARLSKELLEQGGIEAN